MQIAQNKIETYFPVDSGYSHLIVAHIFMLTGKF